MGLCERCEKAPATFHLTNIDPHGERVERHLCDRCAVEEGFLQVKPNMNVNDLIDNLLTTAVKGAATTHAGMVCNHCGISYVEFRNQGLLGCPKDYEAFKEPLLKLIERAHDGATHHVGKTPKSMGVRRAKQNDIQRVRKMLDEAVAAEDYERAATLRDRIREMEGA